MSTSISYKGRVIAAFGNDTKTLNTAGTWLEDDITVTATDSSAAVTVTQELDEHGGIIKHINAIDLSNDTVDAAHLLQGYTAHDRDGNAVTGTYTGESTPTAQSKTVTPTKLTQNVTPDANYDYLSSVTVNPIPNQYIVPTGTKTITTNGTSDVTNYASVSVNVPTDSLIITLTKNQNDDWQPNCTFTEVLAAYRAGKDLAVTTSPATYEESSISYNSDFADFNYTVHEYFSEGAGTSSGVKVRSYLWTSESITQTSNNTKYYITDIADATPSDVLNGKKFFNANGYQEGTIATKTSTDLTSSGATVTVPAGYYATAATKTIADGTQGTPSVNRTTGTNSVTLTPVVVNSAGYINGGTKTGTVVTVTASELVSGTKSITANGTEIDVTNYASVDVNVPTGGGTVINNQNKTVTPTESQQSITADSGYTGLGTVTVNAIANTYVGSGITRRDSDDIEDLLDAEHLIVIPAGYYEQEELFNVRTTYHNDPVVSINSNTGLVTATHQIDVGYYLPSNESATTTGTLQLTTQAAKTVTPTESSQTAVTAGKYTTGAITVAAIPSTYVGSGITQRDETDLTASGATVTVPAGYYAQQETKSVSTTTHPSPTASVNSTTGLVTASHTQGTGYVTGGTTTGTLQLSTAAAATITPTTSSQTAVAAGKYTTGAITVAAIPADYIQTSDATATAADIVSGETAYVNGSKVTGTLVIQHYYTGTTDPSSSLGENGDIYLKGVS